jgi:phosphinothricin acetyltransferase
MIKNIELKKMNEKDWDSVSKIYKEGIATNLATFEKEIPSWESWDKNHLKVCRLVAKNKNSIVGWAALSDVSSRCVYGGVAEVSIYVSKKARGNRVGKQLLKQLIDESEKKGYWTLQSGIFPENIASIELHLKAGFRRIGYREKIGQLDGVWKDNVLFERRSKYVGI